MGFPGRAGCPTRTPIITWLAQAQAAQAFGAWRGHLVGVAVAWPNRGTWADFTQVNSFYTTWAKQPYTKTFGIPLFPENVGATVGACIAGSYDGYWRTFAETMNSTGLAAQGTIIRLGWEFNQTHAVGQSVTVRRLLPADPEHCQRDRSRSGLGLECQPRFQRPDAGRQRSECVSG